MEVSYNLRYQKFTFSNRVLIDKEGEIIIYGKGFRLKGKGAQDKGELINFSEIKEFYYKNEQVFFITFTKEKYVLSDMGNLFDQFITDIYTARNEFLIDALFMKGGKLKAEFDGHFERQSKFGKLINKGEAKFRLYEKSLVVIPPKQDAFSINYTFVNFHEFDDFDYKLKIVMDDSTIIFFSHLGNDFEFFEEKINALLGGMYETVVNDTLREIFPEYHAATLLKLAFHMKGGKTISLKELNKIDKDLSKSVDDFIFDDGNLREKMRLLLDMVDEYNVFYGISQDEVLGKGFIRWIMISVPEKNVVAFTILPRWENAVKESDEKKLEANETFFYKIIMERGNPADKSEDKIREIEQALVSLKFAKDPCYQDKRDLKHSPYQYAIRKMPFLRILRKSFVGKASSLDVSEWQQQAEKIMVVASLKN